MKVIMLGYAGEECNPRRVEQRLVELKPTSIITTDEPGANRVAYNWAVRNEVRAVLYPPGTEYITMRDLEEPDTTIYGFEVE